MKVTHNLFHRNRQGYALLITMIFVGISLLLLGSVMEWSNSSARQAERNKLFSMSTGAADAATERVMAQMWRDYYDLAFNAASSYTGYLPNQTGWPVQFSFSDGSGTANKTGVSITPTDWTANWVTLNAFNSQYTGLSAYVAQCTVTSTATTSNQPYAVSATVQQQFQLASIPIFQFAVFYNLNMEIDPGANMTLTGPVFSNGGIWTRGQGTFNSAVSAVGVLSTNATDPYLTSKSDGTPPTFNSTVTSNADTLSMPISETNDPYAVRSLLGIPPSGVDPYSVTGQEYFVNEADLVISNSSGGNISAYFQDPNNVTPLTQIPYDATTAVTITTTNGYAYTTNITSYTYRRRTYYTTNITSTPITSSYTTNIPYYSFATNVSFFDFREQKTVQAVQLNVGALNSWLNSTNGSTFNDQMYNDSGHYIDSVYVYNNAPSDASDLPSVRVANGATLPTVNGVSDGLTLVTPDPLYVLGDYNASGQSLNNGTNVVDTAPAALIADAITVLSSSWKDSWNSSTSLSSRTPVNTTVNAATFEGIVPSEGNNYSGGVENFLRLLENWGGRTLTYNGSIVVMFPSQYATNHWSGSYYGVPTRRWAFDLNFMGQGGLPPLTPEVRAFVRQGWTVK